jgi:cytochrome c oxidase subunit 2
VRRGSIVQLVLLGAFFGAGATLVALLIPWLPPVASKERHRIDIVFWFTTAICIGIFTLVASLIVYSLLKFRAPEGDDTDGPPIHGHTGIEIVWTAIPALLVTSISIMSGVVLVQNGRAGSNHLNVDVLGRQFEWSFKYPDSKDLVSPNLVLPKGRSVKLVLTSNDVIHSFWVPQFGQKQDAVPGRTTTLVITPTKTGTYPVICTELCGLGHALMRTRAIVMEPADFEKWLKSHGQAVSGGNAGAAVFKNNGCGGCHTLTAAGANATVGPDLDKLAQEAQRAKQPLEAFIHQSIVDPDAYVEPGYPKGLMPKTFADLPKDQLDALVQYLASAAKGAGG